jgi:hypothetical protein
MFTENLRVGHNFELDEKGISRKSEITLRM